jgi:hypothetical protein
VLGELKTEILKAVAGGTFDFHPDDGSDEARARFQTKVRSIVELERGGYLESVKVTPERETGENYIDAVLVGGLRPKGRCYLESVTEGGE